MIRKSSDAIIKSSKTVEIVHMRTEQKTISGYDCSVTIADVRSATRGGVYRVIVNRPQNLSRAYATCICQGAFFSGNCKHIHAVVCRSAQEQL